MATIVCLAVATSCYCQADTIYWKPDNSLKWSDFKGTPDQHSPYLALSSAGITYSVSYNNSSTEYTVKAFFVMPKSWRKINADSNVLRHEQLHFDITELFARKLVKELSAIPIKKRTDQEYIIKMAEQVIAEKNKYQETYDRETKRGTNIPVQEQWQKLVMEQLKASE